MLKTGIIIKDVDAYLNVYQDGSYTIIGLRDSSDLCLHPYNLLYIVDSTFNRNGGIGNAVDTQNGELLITGVDDI